MTAGKVIAENTSHVTYHVAAPRWNLKAPPTTGSERREQVVFHAKSTQVQCSVLHMVTREALPWPQIV